MKELPVRKHPRLKNYDYSSNGAYFITFCVKDGYEMLGQIVGRGIPDAPCVELTEYGKNVDEAIKFLNNKNQNVDIEKYVIMPNHVHIIILIQNEANAMVNSGGVMVNKGGASGKPRPTNALIPKHISSIKRFTNKQAGFDMWQDSYHDHIIRDEADYQIRWWYIDNNPVKWAEDEYFVKK
jgi:REP element-mobilizing transposase RayT